MLLSTGSSKNEPKVLKNLDVSNRKKGRSLETLKAGFHYGRFARTGETDSIGGFHSTLIQ